MESRKYLVAYSEPSRDRQWVGYVYAENAQAAWTEARRRGFPRSVIEVPSSDPSSSRGAPARLAVSY